MSIYDALLQDWTTMTDKWNSELAEASELGLWAYSNPQGGVELGGPIRSNLDLEDVLLSGIQ
jgi:hypothetical protein